MGKPHDLGAFNHGQIVGAQSIGDSNSEIVRQLGFSRSTASRVYQEYMDDGQKNYRSGKRQRTIILDSA
ncbi:hypothetical protein TNCV_1253271 [Trichonephila clavipes]|nr:hypothetical protein TNCV_1253271 [Trichonephila clavipes]